MATLHPVSRFLPAPMTWQDKTRNGLVPDWLVPAGVAIRSQFALRYQRKVVMHYVRSPITGLPATAGVRIDTRWKCRTGENVESGSTISFLAVATLLVPPDFATAGAGNPRFSFNVGGTDSPDWKVTWFNPTPEYSDLQVAELEITGLAANTEYDCYVEHESFLMVASVTVYEMVTLGGVDLDHTTAVMDHRPYAMEREITETQAAQLYSVPYLLYRHNGNHLFNLTPETDEVYWTRTTNSYANLIDQTASTTVSANTPGVNVQLQYHAPAHKDTVTCVFAVYGSNATTAGGDIKLVDASGDVTSSTLSSFSTAGEWKSATVEIDASTDLTKLDVQFQGDGTNVFTVEAVSLYPYTV